jgi:hypothetical protein
MQKPVRTSYTRLAAAIVVPLSLLLAVYYVTDGKLGDIGGDPMRLTAETPSEIALNPDGETAVELKLALTNRTGETIQLTAADGCKVVRWVVQAPGDVFVQSKGPDCVPEEPTRSLGSGETITRTETLLLDSRRYKAGETYTVFVQLWGEETTASFTMAD